MSKPLYGLVEAGGTKFVLGIAHGPDEVLATTRIPTTTPDETIAAMCNWLAGQGPLVAVGVATFGPVEVDRTSLQWGHILATPKAGWSNTNLVGPLVQRLGCPVGLDTDVTAAALAEYRWGAGQGQPSVLYFTIGTGVGGGAVIGGKPLAGISHPEMGHIRLPLHPEDVGFGGVCPFHGTCLEGLASGPAVKARYGVSLSELPGDHIGHDVVAWYIAQAAVTAQAMFEPGRIVLGGGVMDTPGLIDRVRCTAERLGNGYFRSRAGEIVTLPGLGDRSGLLGALALAEAALR
ncbi:ROK family protein [Novosphingobium ginsenosidimutans]|uniref:fructokinase n=1 Tax=Novosphingobium ginsenosidimutans TaxID=1176536 RepID=A0A5B8S2M1_9SPHN|nr:ROK family protein [Novosphingobium ginsenosidimutans]QEA15282.1 ROK family protein [Novosphingobium ginsenosidimutans]